MVQSKLFLFSGADWISFGLIEMNRAALAGGKRILGAPSKLKAGGEKEGNEGPLQQTF